MRYSDQDCYPWEGRPSVKLDDDLLSLCDGTFTTSDQNPVYVWCHPKFENLFWFTTEGIVDFCKKNNDSNFLYVLFTTEDAIFFARPQYEKLSWSFNDNENVLKDIECFNKISASYILEQQLREVDNG